MPKIVPKVVNNELVFFRKYSDKKYSDPWSRKRDTPRLHYYQIKMVREAGVGECLKPWGKCEHCSLEREDSAVQTSVIYCRTLPRMDGWVFLQKRG